MIEFIKQNSKVSDLYITKNVFVQIIEDFKESIIENKETFMSLYEIDKDKTDKYTSIDAIINILDEYKEEEITKNKKEIILASYYGNPYITVNLCVQSLLQKRGTIAVIEDVMYGVNKLLISLFNNILKKYKIVEMIKICNNITIEEIEKRSNMINNIVCIGNSNTYYKYCKKIKNLKYIPFKNFAMYCDSEKFEEIKYELYKYAIKNAIEVEIFDDLDEFIDCVKEDNTLESVVLFSESKESINEVKNRIEKYKIFVNANPFKNEKFLIKNC